MMLPRPGAGLRLYAGLMEDWAQWVLAGAREEDDEVFPVAANPTEEHANMLLARVEHLRAVIAPWMDEGSDPSDR